MCSGFSIPGIHSAPSGPHRRSEPAEEIRESRGVVGHLARAEVDGQTRRKCGGHPARVSM